MRILSTFLIIDSVHRFQRTPRAPPGGAAGPSKTPHPIANSRKATPPSRQDVFKKSSLK